LWLTLLRIGEVVPLFVAWRDEALKGGNAEAKGFSGSRLGLTN